MNEEKFKEIYDDVENTFKSKGQMGLSNWTQMSLHYGQYAEQNNLPPVEDNTLGDAYWQAYCAGAQWGFKQATVGNEYIEPPRNKLLDRIEEASQNGESLALMERFQKIVVDK